MKKLFLTFLLALVAALSFAQRRSNPVQFEYDTYYQYFFENREFDYNVPSLIASSTINGLVLTPSVGLSFFASSSAAS